MLFLRHAVATALALLSVSASAAQSPADVVGALDALTSVSLSLQTAANNINELSGATGIIGAGAFPDVSEGIERTIHSANELASANRDTQPLPASPDATKIVNAYTKFLDEHRKFWIILTGKSGALTNLLIGPPIIVYSKQLAQAIDILVFSLSDMVPSEADNLQAKATELYSTLRDAEEQYSRNPATIIANGALVRRHARDIAV
ncbi:hypothetical protein TWF696_007531 [Orbilia brochopaga]|uniref:Uncharacterized protein n=1 Tax=Orbilia brochopaga TaxID=3140254 RepID=A0AAV9UPW9_9PEZI